MNQTRGRPSECLMGLDLKEGWKVIEHLQKKPHDTGSGFSSGYLVKNINGMKAFLKAMDFSLLLKTNPNDLTTRMQQQTSIYNFERDLLYKCKNKKLSKVIMPICDGTVTVSNFPPIINQVPYIIFELADGNIRTTMVQSKTFDLTFYLRSLHNAALGLAQLHRTGIAHQDLKPSNILVFRSSDITGSISKISDLGRSSDKSNSFIFDNMPIPGQFDYAPWEQLFQYHFSRDFNERFAGDMFQLGSMIFFYFSKTTARQATQVKLNQLLGNNQLSGNFMTDIPLLEGAFSDALRDFWIIISKYSEKLANDLVEITRQLCEPNPEKRGNPKNIKTNLPQFDLQPFVSKLDLFASRARNKYYES